MIRRFFLLTTALALLGPVVFQSTHAAERVSLERIVAVVNDDVILASELEQRLQRVKDRLREQGTPIPSESRLTQQVLDRLVTEQLQLQLAERTGVRVDDQSLNEAMRRIAKQNGLSLTEFREVLERDGYEFAQFREQIRTQMTLSRLRQRQVQNKVRVSDREIRQYLEKEQPLAENREYRLGHILVAVPSGASPDTVQQARAKAERLMQRLRQGADFAQLAVAESDGQQALEGGDLGWRSRARLPTVFAERVTQLSPGKITGPIRSPSGFHIIKLLGQRGGERHVVTQSRLRRIVLETDKVMSEEQAQTRLAQLKRRVEQGEDFAELARAHSDDAASAAEGGDMGWVAPQQLAPPLRQAIQSLEPGEVSQPIQTPAGWQLLQVVDRRQHDSTEEYLRARARQALHKRKAEERLELWLRRLRDEAYVDIRLSG